MKICVFGATGGTGRQVVLQALERGWSVSALVRNPQALQDVQSDKFTALQCDIFSTDSVSESVAGCDAVLSCLGSRASPWRAVSMYSDSMKHIVAGMRKAGVNRLVVVTASCTKSEPGNPWLVEWVLKPVFLGRVLTDMARMEDYLRGEECSDINFTIVKPNGLTDNKIQEVDIATSEKECVPGGSFNIPRANVAKFMIDSLENETWNRKAVSIAV